MKLSIINDLKLGTMDYIPELCFHLKLDYNVFITPDPDFMWYRDKTLDTITSVIKL